jgi:sugar phosphate isomerase/epimerase
MFYSVSTWNYLKSLGSAASFENGLEEITEAGFGAELWLGWTNDPNLFKPGHWERIKSLCVGLPRLSAHSAVTHAFSFAALVKEMDFCAHVGADPLVCHPWTFGLDVGTWDYESKKVLSEEEKEFISNILSEAADRSLTLALENGPVDILVQVLTAMASHPGEHYLGICIDSGHANMHSDMSTSPTVDVIRPVKDRIIHLHLHDNDGVLDDHRIPGDGVSDWPAVFAEMGGREFAGDIVFELNSPNPGKSAQQARAFVEKHLSGSV